MSIASLETLPPPPHPPSNQSCARWVTAVRSKQMHVRVFPRPIISQLPPSSGSDLCACAYPHTCPETQKKPNTGDSSAYLTLRERGELRFSIPCVKSISGAPLHVCVWERWATRAPSPRFMSAPEQQRAPAPRWWAQPKSLSRIEWTLNRIYENNCDTLLSWYVSGQCSHLCLIMLIHDLELW